MSARSVLLLSDVGFRNGSTFFCLIICVGKGGARLISAIIKFVGKE